ncbi:MAG: hypothetical protein AAFX99_25720, partial [Myxococcota bacterium]
RLFKRCTIVHNTVDQALELAEQIASLQPTVALGIKSVVQAASLDRTEDAILKERQVFASLWASEHHERQVRAFLARKRSPKATQGG